MFGASKEVSTITTAVAVAIVAGIATADNAVVTVTASEGPAVTLAVPRYQARFDQLRDVYPGEFRPRPAIVGFRRWYP